MHQVKPLKFRIDDALSNEQLHTNFRSAMSYLVEKNHNCDQLDMNAYQLALEKANEIFPVQK